MRKIAIIQARMGSTRLPGKVLKKIGDETLLEYQINRVLKAELIDKTVVATSVLEQDTMIESLCKKIGIACFRGSENDVLSRYYDCAKTFGADIVVRLTADCPFSDPEIIDATVRLFNEKRADYAANTVPPGTSMFPDGSDVEVFSMDALERAFKEAKDTQDREHVTFFFWKGGHGFKTTQLRQSKNMSKYRFTVDYPEDLDVVETIMGLLKEKNLFGHVSEIVDIIDKNPLIREKNKNYHFGIGWGRK